MTDAADSTTEPTQGGPGSPDSSGRKPGETPGSPGGAEPEKPPEQPSLFQQMMAEQSQSVQATPAPAAPAQVHSAQATPVPASSGRAATAHPATARSGEAPKRKKFPFLVPVLMLLAGVAIGGLVMRTHDRRPVVVVGVNGFPIDRNQFYRSLESVAGSSVIHKLVQDRLIVEFAEKEGLMPAETVVDSKFLALSKQPNYQRYLAVHHLTPEDFKQDLRVSLARTAVLGQGVTVSDAEIKKFYDQNTDPRNPKARYYTPESVQLAVIATRKETEAYAALSDLARATSWGIVAQTHSIDPSAKNGGMLAPMVKGRSPMTRIPGMETAVFGMKQGGQIGPQQFGGAWWIIRCIDKKPAQTQPLSAVEDDCRTAVTLAKGMPANAKKVGEEFAAFEKNANIQAFWPQYSPDVAVAGK